MSMPPLANLFAVYYENPAILEEITLDMKTSGDFVDVWQPFLGWVVGVKYLPKSKPDSEFVRKHGLAFVEGRDLVVDQAGKDPSARIQEVIDCVDSMPENLERFFGDFGFIRFMPHGAATVVRSCGGLVPFYLWQSDSSVAISTQLGSFVRYLPVELELDPLVNAVWCTGYGLFPDRRTFLKNISILDRGSFARIEDRGTRIGQYWNPRPKTLGYPSKEKQKEHIEKLRTILIDKLKRDLDSEGGNLLTLSGGVDSSSLAALAAGTLGYKIWTWSLLPAPDDLFEHEMSYIQPLVDKFGIERTWAVRLEEKARIQLVRSAPRILFYVMHPALCSLPKIIQDAKVNVLFGGEFADQICGSTHTIPDWISHTSLIRLISSLGRLPLGQRDVLMWVKHRVLKALGKTMLPFSDKLPDFIHSRVREEYSTWVNQRRHTILEDNDPLKYLILQTEQDGFITMNWEAASFLDIRRSFPFFNREVLELAFECHPAELIGPGTKKLIRAALINDVPEKNLLRPDKGHWRPYLRDEKVLWQGMLPDMVGSVVKEEWYPKPPEVLDYAVARSLTQFIMFAQTHGQQRAEQKVSNRINRINSD